MHTGRIYLWLKKEIPLRKIPQYILGAIAIDIVATIILVTIVVSFIDLPEILTKDDVIWWMPIVLVGTAIIEELLFRGPLYFKFVQKTPARLYIGIVVMALVFGIAHGSVQNIFVQGFGGLLFSVLFLKGGGLQGKFWRGIAVSAATHALFDCILWMLFTLTVN